MIRRFNILIYSICFVMSIGMYAQKMQRPFIWVDQHDKAEILHKIKSQAWATTFYKSFKERTDHDLAQYSESPEQFLKKIPFDWDKQRKGQTPPLKQFVRFNDQNAEERFALKKTLQIGVDCGVLYFLTEDEKYAQCALDILHAFVEGISQLKPSDNTGNGGWVYPNDHLREARVIGAQMPIIYDFVASYIDIGKKAYDLGKKTKVNFSKEKAQELFKTYARLAIEHGHRGSNWPVLESFSLVGNALAVDDLEERKKLLNFYLYESSDKQDALPDVAIKYKKDGDVFPETSQYSNGVANYTTRLMILLNKYDAGLRLGSRYYKIPFSLDRWKSVRYPNGEIIRFGDGKRTFKTPYSAYEMAYALGVQDSVSKLTEKFGALLNEAISTGSYDPSHLGKRTTSAQPYWEPTRLLWLNSIPKYAYEHVELPRTDEFTHAGVFLQRNLGTAKNPKHALMCFVGGGHMVHGHASGMDMELYGLGEVLGVDNGRGSYRKDIHENYSRIFAAHNTVIVNGASQGEGGWVNLGMNSTKLLAMEPHPMQEARSPWHSFTTTRFTDDRGEKAEATQERTMAIVKTSETTGYYLDVFRSKSSLPNEFHDYLYHNIGDQLVFLNKDLKLKVDKERYQANTNIEWKQNRSYRNPGWHFFKNVQTSEPYKKDVKVQFKIKGIKKKEGSMNLFIVGNDDREYTKVMAPKTYEAPKPYGNKLTPTLVIRQQGEAWSNPFAVVYEPTFEKDAAAGVQSVKELEQDGVFKGFKVSSRINGKDITQFCVIQNDDEQYVNKEYGFSFQGHFAIITIDTANKLQDVYIGEGYLLTYKKLKVMASDSKSIKAFIDFSLPKYKMNATQNTKVDIDSE
ncbi:heparinase II/III domain-containing protein [Spongiivirga citrea]|uniref:Heparinase n=1 Tax=Spongiivirga citrea TaxID=1481457 RepID=A0A6M0CJ00_9FLAO|nr:heparinase II/III family protein [Spongiivirga citrea]NER17821.1 hypothetical protein [Spongiivirga citrea]